jgi:ribosomal protein L37AE/L43A
MDKADGTSDGGRAQNLNEPRRETLAARAPAVDGVRASEACCDRCGSVRLIRVKACWRCEACGYKSDCNGW